MKSEAVTPPSYRYSDMMLDIEKLMEDPARAPFIKKETLCETLAGNDVPILTVTSSDPVFDIRNKKFVIVTSRVHPGESPSSWIMRGILHYITGKAHSPAGSCDMTVTRQGIQR